MKRYGNLFHKVASVENIYLAHRKAQKGKRHYPEVKAINRDEKAHVLHLHKMLTERKFTTSEYKVETRRASGKIRQIFVLPYFPDRIVHHCIMNVIEPIWKTSLIRDTYSSIKGRGIHDGWRRMQKFLEDADGTAYCLKMDVQKFYPSVDHDVLKFIIRKKIKDPDLLALLDEIIDSAPGVPIGNYLSQYFGNIYLSPLDHHIKNKLGMKYYLRYCDDLVLLGQDKPTLSAARAEIERFAKDELRLLFNQNWQIFPTKIRGIDFLGYRFFGDFTLVRKSIAQGFKRAMQDIRLRPGPTSINRAMSYRGWFKYANARRLWAAYAPAFIHQRCQ